MNDFSCSMQFNNFDSTRGRLHFSNSQTLLLWNNLKILKQTLCSLRGLGFGFATGFASGSAVAVVSKVRRSAGNIRQTLRFGIRTIGLKQNHFLNISKIIKSTPISEKWNIQYDFTNFSDAIFIISIRFLVDVWTSLFVWKICQKADQIFIFFSMQ